MEYFLFFKKIKNTIKTKSDDKIRFHFRSNQLSGHHSQCDSGKQIFARSRQIQENQPNKHMSHNLLDSLNNLW